MIYKYEHMHGCIQLQGTAYCVMVMVIRNGSGNVSSNPGEGCLHFYIALIL